MLLIYAGVFVMCRSDDVQQYRIQYAGKTTAYHPWGTRDEEVHTWKADEGTCSKLGEKCEVSFELKQAMKPPILMYYAVGPFYQNYNDYLVSEVPGELRGQVVSQADRAAKCSQHTRRVDGKEVVPCGMKAWSFFNDSYTLTYDNDSTPVAVSLEDQKGIGWQEDEHRYDNPPEYDQLKYGSFGKDNTSWLFERNDKIPQHEGVENRHFVEWMRPGALPDVWKRYAFIDETLEAGSYTVSIENNFDVTAWDGYKQLVFTELDPFIGGRNYMFGKVLVFYGVSAILLTYLALNLEWVEPYVLKKLGIIKQQPAPAQRGAQ